MDWYTFTASQWGGFAAADWGGFSDGAPVGDDGLLLIVLTVNGPDRIE